MLGFGSKVNMAFALFWFIGFASAGAQEIGSLAALQKAFSGEHSRCRVKINGLHATTDILGRPSEVRIIDGVASRGASRFVHGAVDLQIAVGQIVRVIRIEEVDGQKNDTLRVTVETSGVTLPLAFVAAKGSLAAMSQQQMQLMVAQVLEPMQPEEQSQAAASPPAAGLPAKASAPNQPAAPQIEPLANENVLELNGILKRHNGDAILKAEGFHAAMQSPEFTRDNVIIDGIFQQRATGGIYRGMRDMVLWPNSHVQFVQLSAFTDEHHDLLHLVVRSDLGAFCPITFLYEKGELSKLSKLKMMRAIDPFAVFAGADEHTFERESTK